MSQHGYSISVSLQKGNVLSEWLNIEDIFCVRVGNAQPLGGLFMDCLSVMALVSCQMDPEMG